MKHLKKAIAVLLSALLISSLLLPVVCFAADTVPGDHTSFEDFWDSMTDDEGNVDWKKLPKILFKSFLWIRIFEAIGEFFRGIFGIVIPEPIPDATAPEEIVPEVTTALVAA